MMAPALRVLEGRARTYRQTWRGSVISTFLNPIMFLVAMGLGLGRLVDAGAGREGLGGLDYLVFLAPGLLVATAMQTGAGDGAYPVLAGIKWVKTYHAALATPIGVRDLVLGHLAWTGLRLTFSSLVFAVIAAIFGAIGWVHALAIAPVGMLCGLAYAAPVSAYAASLENDTGLATLFRFGIVPMFLFSGAFFPISQLPDWLQPLANIVPVWHGVELARGIATGLESAWPWPVHVVYLLVWVVAGSLAAMYAFHRRLVH